MIALKVAIAGLGTVGSRVVSLLEERACDIAKRYNRKIDITAVSARNRNKDRGINLAPYRWYDDPQDIASADDVDVIVELIGGSDGVALNVCRAGLKAGRSIVTANKAMLAHHGTDLALYAEKNHLMLKWEASVAGGVPVVKAISEGLAANRFSTLYGILNGTCNYILSKMYAEGSSFDDALAMAQKEGYAEADPSTDIDGIDTAHKISLLASLCFGTKPNINSVHIEGIRHIRSDDITFAKNHNSTIKLIGGAKESEGRLYQYVYPAIISLNSPLGYVDGTMNKVFAEADNAGPIAIEGAGAGADPTASAVVADIIDVAKNRTGPVFGIPFQHLTEAQTALSNPTAQRFYLRLPVFDEIGVLAKITSILSDYGLSVEKALQENVRDSALLFFIMHKTTDQTIRKAVEKITAENMLSGQPCLLRIEEIS